MQKEGGSVATGIFTFYLETVTESIAGAAIMPLSAKHEDTSERDMPLFFPP